MNKVIRTCMMVFLALFFVTGLAACGGSGGGDTPVTPTAIYGGAATAGDVFVIKMDYPSTGKATSIQSTSDGTVIETKELSYTFSGHTYTFTDSGGNVITGFLAPDAFIVVQLPDDIIIAVKVDTTIKTVADLQFLKDKNYILTQFRHDRKGVKWVRSNVDSNGAITGHHANADNVLPFDLDDLSETNDFPEGMDLDNFVYNNNTLGFNLTVEDEGETETWTLYYTLSGLGVIDKGPLKGIRFNTLKGTSTTPPSGLTVGDVFDTIFYSVESEGHAATSVGTITVTEIDADSFVVAVNDGVHPSGTVRMQATASDLWRGFYDIYQEGITRVNAEVQAVGTNAIVFAGKQGEWRYNYGVGVK